MTLHTTDIHTLDAYARRAFDLAHRCFNADATRWTARDRQRHKQLGDAGRDAAHMADWLRVHRRQEKHWS